MATDWPAGSRDGLREWRGREFGQIGWNIALSPKELAPSCSMALDHGGHGGRVVMVVTPLLNVLHPQERQHANVSEQASMFVHATSLASMCLYLIALVKDPPQADKAICDWQTVPERNSIHRSGNRRSEMKPTRSAQSSPFRCCLTSQNSKGSKRRVQGARGRAEGGISHHAFFACLSIITTEEAPQMCDPEKPQQEQS